MPQRGNSTEGARPNMMTERESLIKSALETKFSEGAAENLEELIRQDERERLAAEIEALPTPTWGFEAGRAWREAVLALVRGVGRGDA